MSAIAAVYNLDKRAVEPLELLKVCENLNHRGREDWGILLDDFIGLVHQMRRTTQESFLEKLPTASADANYFLTCDARIDNRAELISQLSFSERADKISDSLIILEAYKKWGEEAPAYLIGDFVFAIWDKCERKLFAARDPLGVKHFYYYFEPGKLFALASEIKALFQIKGLRRELDEQQLADYLVVNSEDKESTFFRNIKRLPATHTLTVEKKDLRIRQYWQPKFEEIRLKSDGEYHEAFREKFTQAVTSRLRSAFPVGSFLSGGLDSSAIVCIAAEYLKARGKPPLETFSAVFPKVAETDKRIDERAFMQAVIDKTGCRAHFVEVDNDNPLREMEKICWYADHPVGAPNVYMDWEIYRAARDKGVRILLSGTDGDSTVGYGYEDFAQLVQRRMFFRLFRDAFALHKNIPCRSHRPKQLIWHRGFKPVAPPALLRLWRVLRRHKPEDPEKPQVHFPLHFSCVRREIRRAFELEDRIDRLYRKNYPPEASAAENHWRGLTSGHFSFTLEQLEKISAAFGIEQRYPFFDRRLIEFCIALPPGQRIYKGWTRSIFRHAMAGILPPEVQWRKDKSNLGAGIKLNLLKYGSREIEEALNLSSDVLEKYVDVEVLRKAYRDYQSDPLNKDREALLILSNVYLSKWLRQAGFA